MNLKDIISYGTQQKYLEAKNDSSSWSVDDEHTLENFKGRCPAPRPPHVTVEKIEGGLVVAGVIVFNSCQFILPAFGCLFLVVGTVLTVTSYYQTTDAGNRIQQYIERVEFTKNSRLLGPICLAVASVMIISGLMLWVVNKRARLKQQRIGFHCPIHGDFYPSNPVSNNGLKSHKQLFWCCDENTNGDEEDLVGLPPQCPHSTFSSQRSSFSSSCHMNHCPAPLPFVTSGSLSGLTMASANLPSEFVFGSIRSLSVSHDVASFPASRSPSPTPIDRVSPSPSAFNLTDEVARIDAIALMNSSVVSKVTPEIKLVSPAPNLVNKNINFNNISTTTAITTTTDSASNSSSNNNTTNVPINEPRRKSVTIMLPGEKHIVK